MRCISSVQLAKRLNANPPVAFLSLCGTANLVFKADVDDHMLNWDRECHHPEPGAASMVTTDSRRVAGLSVRSIGANEELCGRAEPPDQGPGQIGHRIVKKNYKIQGPFG